MNLDRHLREIHEIELSSVCNLACVYCPHPSLQRPKRHMEWPTFLRSLEHVAYYCRTGTQGELALTGIGEAILHPRLDEALAVSRATLGPSRPLTLSTNGVAMTMEIAQLLARFKVAVYVSLHRPEMAGPALRMLETAGCMVTTNHAFVDSSLDWAGQVEWHVSGPKHQCGYLSRRWGVIREDGAVDACCMDAHDLHPVGHVSDAVGTLRTKAIPLCASCNLYPPREFGEAA